MFSFRIRTTSKVALGKIPCTICHQRLVVIYDDFHSNRETRCFVDTMPQPLAIVWKALPKVVSTDLLPTVTTPAALTFLLQLYQKPEM
jgi:hypothetical protein